MTGDRTCGGFYALWLFLCKCLGQMKHTYFNTKSRDPQPISLWIEYFIIFFLVSSYSLRDVLGCETHATLYNPTSCIHILYSVLYAFPKVLTKRIFYQSIASLVCYHFLYCCDVDVWFRGNIIRRNKYSKNFIYI